MEVRYHNLSVTANVTVTGEITSKSELPTVFNAIKRSMAKFAWNKRVVHKEIVKNVSGVFKPGTMTLLLGQPGSGKTSLMRVLAGQFPKSEDVKIEGDVTYNGVSREEIRKVLPQFSAYVTQFDKHFPTLTVQETLDFAYAVCGGGMSKHKEEMLSHSTPEQNAEASETAQKYFENFPDLVIEQLGLQICRDTILGSNMLRGVSGGELKRVTTGEMEFGMKYMTLMDEIGTGLDSAATFDIITTQHSIAKCLHKTIVIALLQPAPEVFNLFDNVMVLNQGKIIYHGPRDQAVPYFETLGFKCPPRRDAADFLLDLGTKLQLKYQVELPAGITKHPRLASEYSGHWRISHLYEYLIRDIESPHDQELLRDVDESYARISSKVLGEHEICDFSTMEAEPSKQVVHYISSPDGRYHGVDLRQHILSNGSGGRPGGHWNLVPGDDLHGSGLDRTSPDVLRSSRSVLQAAISQFL